MFLFIFLDVNEKQALVKKVGPTQDIYTAKEPLEQSRCVNLHFALNGEGIIHEIKPDKMDSWIISQWQDDGLN